MTDHNLIERVDKLLSPSKPPPEWGSANLSSTPAQVAIQDLARRTEALESALREVARELQKLSHQD